MQGLKVAFRLKSNNNKVKTYIKNRLTNMNTLQGLYELLTNAMFGNLEKEESKEKQWGGKQQEMVTLQLVQMFLKLSKGEENN